MKIFPILKVFFVGLAVFLLLGGAAALFSASAQVAGPFPVGERLTYNISFEKFENSAYAETYVVSKGKLDGREAVELYGRLRTVDLVSAAFYLFDESRTTFVDAGTGLPLYVRSVSRASGLPKERITSFLETPTVGHDLLSLIYRVRSAGGTGGFTVTEDGRLFNFDLAAAGAEVVETDAGVFETVVSNVSSPYLAELGLTNFRINLTTDERKIPVLIRFRTPKGTFTARLASIQDLTPETVPTPTPVGPVVTTPTPSPTPVPTPTPYIGNLPLSTDLPFVLGETLEFSISGRGENYGRVVLQVRERKEFNDEDSLLLQARVLDKGPVIAPLFDLSDLVEAQVDPYTLAPKQVRIVVRGPFSSYNQVADFDQELGTVEFTGGGRVEVPVGTHSILSLAYAIRNFNLRPSLDPKNPVNDTRVAVFFGSQPYVLTLRPSDTTLIDLEGRKVPAQLISVQTGDPAIDSYNVRLWLSTDRKRLPLRLAVGEYQADLVTATVVPPK